jgi:hypothetical protein
MDVNITQFNVQLYFKEPVLDAELLKGAFAAGDGFAASLVAADYGSHPMQGTASFYRDGFRIAPVQSNVLPYRILQVMSYPNALKNPDAETVECLRFVQTQLKERLQVDLERDVYAVRVVSHAIVNGSPDVQRVLSKLSTIENVPSLASRYVAHKNPMDAVQFVTRTGNELSQDSWSDIHVSQFNTSSYVVTVFSEMKSLALAIPSIINFKQFAATLMREMEQAASQA